MKKNDEILVWLIIGAAILFASGSIGYKVYTMTRGLRNNNPGNIRHSASQWQGMRAIQDDKDFVQFETPVYGIRALVKLIKNYQVNSGLKTIREIINRWAPPSENDTGAYVQHVAREVGLSPDAAINVNDYMVPIVKTIIKHENGLNPYDDGIIRQGISLA